MPRNYICSRQRRRKSEMEKNRPQANGTQSMAGQLCVQFPGAWRHGYADQPIAFAQGLHHLITQIVLGTHEPVALLARLAPLQQESGAEVGTPEQGNRMIQTAQFG